MIRLVEIREDNFFAARALSVAPEQQGFLDSAVVGLALVKDMDDAPACYDLQQFMIDRCFQRRGWGAQALRQLLERLADEGKYDCVEVCVRRDDLPALRLYEGAGFSDTGYIDPDAPDCLNLMHRFNRTASDPKP